jgi:hypothetical protein
MSYKKGDVVVVKFPFVLKARRRVRTNQEIDVEEVGKVMREHAV